MVVYGPSGVGKTSFAANFPKAGFLIDPQEEGIRDLVEFHQCPRPVFIEEADTFSGLIQVCEGVARDSRGIETLVGDSLTGFEKLCFIHHCEEYFDGDWSRQGFYSYQQGPKNAAKTDWPRFLEALDGVRAAGINVVLIAHSQVKGYTNPEGPDYDRYIPYMDKETWSAVHRWAKAILFYNYHVEIDRSKKLGPRDKARTEVEERFIYTDWSPAFDAKNRWGLESLLDAGDSGEEAFKAFRAAYKKVGK